MIKYIVFKWDDGREDPDPLVTKIESMEGLRSYLDHETGDSVPEDYDIYEVAKEFSRVTIKIREKQENGND